MPRSYLNFVRTDSTNDCSVININSSLGIDTWISKSCKDSNGFICQQNVDSSLPDTPEPTPSTNYIQIFNDSVKLIPQKMSWDAVKKHCEDDGANLASIRSEWTQAYIELLVFNLNSPLWIGLNRAQTNGYFKFIDGWSMKFTKWGKNEPSRKKTCVYVDGEWKTDYCSQTIGSVCMKSTEVPPKVDPMDFPGVCPEDILDETHPEYHYSRSPFRGHCYKFFSEKKYWSFAATSCAEHDPSEQEFILSNIRLCKDSATSYWIGLFKTSQEKWKWLDNTVMDFTNWRKGSKGYNTYGEIDSSDGTWSVSFHWEKKPYICKTAKVLLPKPSPSSLSPHVQKTPGRNHILVAVMIIVAGLALGTVVSLVLFKKCGHHLSIPNSLTNFDNPIFFGNNHSQNGLVDTKSLVENDDEQNTQPITV